MVVLVSWPRPEPRGGQEKRRKTFLGAVVVKTLAGAAPPPLRLGIAGFVHMHASGFLARYRDCKDVELVGISEPDPEVAARYVKNAWLDPATIHRSLDEILDRAKPQAVVAFSTADQPVVVAACATHKVPVMMEKPLAVSESVP